MPGTGCQFLIIGKDQICGAIDYSLSSTYFNIGPKIFTYNGISAGTYRNDSLRTVRIVAPDKHDRIWFTGYGEYGYISGNRWIIDNSSLKDEGIFAIAHKPDGEVWIGTGQGICILAPF